MCGLGDVHRELSALIFISNPLLVSYGDGLPDLAISVKELGDFAAENGTNGAKEEVRTIRRFLES